MRPAWGPESHHDPVVRIGDQEGGGSAIDGTGPDPRPEHPLQERLDLLCRLAVASLDVGGAIVDLMSADAPGTIAAASDPASRTVAELEFELGEGPATEAFARTRPVLVPELDREGAARWPAYAAAASAHGVGAVFAFPLHVGAARFGVLVLFCPAPRRLTGAGVRTGLSLGESAVEILLDGLADQLAHPASGSPPSTRQGAATVAPGADLGLDLRNEVYQAQGMVMVDLAVTLAEALARLRAYAFAADRGLADVARDVVAGRIRINDDRPHGRAEEPTT